MKRAAWIFAAMALALAAPSARAQHEHHSMSTRSAEPEQAPQTFIEGLLVNADCHREGLTGNDCPVSPYERNQPLGVVSDDGTFYRLSPGERQTRATRLANMALGHALMMVEMPMMVINELTDFKAKVTSAPEVEVRRMASSPSSRWIGRRVMVQGELREDDSGQTLVFSEVKLVK